MRDESITPDVVTVRPFVPAPDFATSKRFYADLGFTIHDLGPAIASIELGRYSFLLQDYNEPAFAGHFMMQLIVNDLDAWWRRIEGLDLAGKYGVRAPKAPAMQPWGLIVAYVVDPAGVLWHVVQQPK